MRINIYIIVLAALFLSACDNFLDVKPTGVKIPETVKDFDQLLENPYVSRNNWTNLNFWDPDITLNQEMLRLLGSQKAPLNRYKWAKDIYTTEESDSDWDKYYKYIYTFNSIIDDIDSAPLNDLLEKDRLRIKGEAYGQRAMEYFLLVSEYGFAYSESNKEKTAVPMPLNADITEKLQKATVGEIYQQILSDLKTAETLLDNSDAINANANFRPGKASVKGLLAVVSLHMGDFENAKKYSEESLALHSELYDFTVLSNNVEGDAWSGVNIADIHYGLNDKSVLWNRINQSSYSYPYEGHLLHPDLVDLFDITNDQRFVLFTSNHTDETIGQGIDVSPMLAYASKNKPSQAGVTTYHLLLAKAEACARTKDKDGAIEALNALLVKRIKGFTSLQAADFATDEDLLKRVKEERRKELMATGANVIDLKRYHALGEEIPTFERIIGADKFTLEPGSTGYVISIPLKNQALNSNL